MLLSTTTVRALALACTGTIALAAPHATRGHAAGEILVEHGVASTSDGTQLHYEVGTLFVPENRAVPQSRLIGVGFARIKGARTSTAPPVFLLVGGPGVTLLETLSDSSEAARRRLTYWRNYGNGADFVVIEQRGYSRRGDMLEWTPAAEPLDKPRSAAADAAAMLAAAHKAVADNPGRDLAGYTLAACADDVDDLRRALGYEKIALIAASFGSQWSFAVMRLHPGLVQAAVLSAIEPLDSHYDMPSNVHATLQRIAFEADQDPGLKPYLPSGGVMAAARRT